VRLYLARKVREKERGLKNQHHDRHVPARGDPYVVKEARANSRTKFLVRNKVYSKACLPFYCVCHLIELSRKAKNQVESSRSRL
jgi:hypothetical protein